MPSSNPCRTRCIGPSTWCSQAGIRRGELCALNLESVDVVEGRLTLPPKRKRSGRLIPIDLELATVLTAYLNRLPLYARAEGERALFTGRTGKRIGRNRVYDIVVTPAVRAGLHDTSTDRLEQHTKFTPHHYRHWLTTKLRQNGCSERVIRAIRGDADHSTADRYDHVTWEPSNPNTNSIFQGMSWFKLALDEKERG